MATEAFKLFVTGNVGLMTELLFTLYISDRNPVTDNCGLRVRSWEECFSLNDFDGDAFVLDECMYVDFELVK